ncbi:hypothetical protein [Thioclava sp. GXIMD4216]|uniref:Secreted protein n=1 Tax=Thioclava litoralis TaxID=3076557 RepID=A0ABZ1E5N3_9RHOB|nr:hypothetical protein RPE78_14500 [Thioclava sp. FTW29]
MDLPEPFRSEDEMSDKTQPPIRFLRFDTPAELYGAEPYLTRMTQLRPGAEETGLNFLLRLRGSTTPEEAVIYTAFAAVPHLVVWWAYECLRRTLPEPTAPDRAILALVADWTRSSDATNRWRVMQSALFAPVRSPAVYLGLAVGWSGGAIAPNDPAPVPSHRMPQAINAAILSAVAMQDLRDRPILLAKIIDEAARLFAAH